MLFLFFVLGHVCELGPRTRKLIPHGWAKPFFNHKGVSGMPMFCQRKNAFFRRVCQTWLNVFFKPFGFWIRVRLANTPFPFSNNFFYIFISFVFAKQPLKWFQKKILKTLRTLLDLFVGPSLFLAFLFNIGIINLYFKVLTQY